MPNKSWCSMWHYHLFLSPKVRCRDCIWFMGKWPQKQFFSNTFFNGMEGTKWFSLAFLKNKTNKTLSEDSLHRSYFSLFWGFLVLFYYLPILFCMLKILECIVLNLQGNFNQNQGQVSPAITAALRDWNAHSKSINKYI